MNAMARLPGKRKRALVSCLSCGQTSPTFVLERLDNLGLEPKADCPKCGCDAYTNNLEGLWAFMAASAQEIVRLKLDLMDVQSDGEEER